MAADDITIENLRQLLHIQTELREQAETRWRKAQRVLVGLLETFAPEEVDQRLKTGRPLDHLPVDELEQLVRQQVGNRLHQAQSLLKESQTAQRVQNLRDQLEKLIAQDDESAPGKQAAPGSNQPACRLKRSIYLNQLAALQALSSQEQQSST